VYVSDIGIGRDTAWLSSRGVGTVVNCVDRREAKPLPQAVLAAAGVRRYVALDMDDAPRDGYAARVLAGADALAAGRASGHAVLVHCAAGVSRSGTVLLAFLLRHGARQWPALTATAAAAPLDEADVALHGPAEAAAAPPCPLLTPCGPGTGLPLAAAGVLARSRRRQVHPNLGFWRLLRELDQATHGKHSVSEDMLGLHKEAIAARAAGRGRGGGAAAARTAGEP
jgi:hypothetical protein